MKIFEQPLNKFRRLLLGGILLLVVINILVRFLGGHTYPPHLQKDSCLIISDLCISQSKLEANNRLQMLVSLHSQASSELNQNQHEIEHSRTQYQGIYIALLAVMVAYLLGRDKPLKDAHGGYWVIFATILIMYGIDVHGRELSKRSYPIIERYNNTSDSLLRIQPTDSTWYSIDYPHIVRISDSLAIPEVYVLKKLELAVRPDIEQSFLYLFPLWLIVRIGKEHWKNYCNEPPLL